MQSDTNEILRFNSKAEPKYRFLSNFFVCNIIIFGHEFSSTEKAYQWFKAVLAGNPIKMNQIENSKTSVETKRLGKYLIQKGTKLDVLWNNIKHFVMMTLNSLKYQQNPYLKTELLYTNPKVLLEDSPDTFWGSGHFRNVFGNNAMGKILMMIRDNKVPKQIAIRDSM